MKKHYDRFSPANCNAQADSNLDSLKLLTDLTPFSAEIWLSRIFFSLEYNAD
jgi:hypothetical protein